VTPTQTPSPEVLEPVVGPITFAADITDDNEPIEPAISFPAELEEIHAIFEYEGMSEEVTWERHWIQDGTEVGTGSGPWDAGDSGTFDLSLTGDGEPLGSGTWKLEIYVNGELARAGTFLIEEEEAPPAPPPPRVRKITFSRWDGGKHNMYIANTDGSGEQFILERAAGPSWSDDGQFLSFYGEEGVDRQVRDGVEYAMSGISNGILWVKVANFPSDITQVEMGQFHKEGSARWAAWAPSGDMIAYDAAPGGPDRRVYFLGTADNRQFNIEIPGEQGDWAPDSNQVVYRSGRDGKQGIWISNRDDSGARNITNDGSDSFPAWSDDGRKIAFHRDSGGNVDIYVMNVDGSNVQRLTDAPGPDTLPTWTPDGQIVFRSARGGSWNIWIMNASGGGQKQIIAGADPGPDWAFGRMDVR
jgi:TolB protein